MQLDTSHFNYRKVIADKNKGREINRKFTNEEIFIENWPGSPTSVKKRYRKLVNYICVMCGNAGIHNNKPLVLQLDHINGVNNDNRLENLRWLCPNCHTQTDTFSSK